MLVARRANDGSREMDARLFSHSFYNPGIMITDGFCDGATVFILKRENPSIFEYHLYVFFFRFTALQIIFNK
jgi:hypothetical protein